MALKYMDFEMNIYFLQIAGPKNAICKCVLGCLGFVAHLLYIWK